LHAATIVTAGVFLLIKCSFLFEYTVTLSFSIALWGLLTSLFAATCAIFQNDIKRIIAYSTCSQLGYIVFIAGLSQYSISLFHLYNHAFFKALLFLSAGLIIHTLNDEQDLRLIGNLNIFLPSLYYILLVGNLALIG
jgi:NADH-ubiquinone oxidoreductase chain 5